MWYKESKKKYTSAIVAIWFDKNDIDSLKLKHNISKSEFTNDEEFHITLMYLGELSDIKKDRGVIEKCIESISSEIETFSIKLGGIAQFFNDDKKKPLVLTINSVELENLRNKVKQSMSSIGIHEPDGSPAFVPHMTLGFVENFNNLNDISMKSYEMKVKGIHISWGGNLKEFKFKTK